VRLAGRLDDGFDGLDAECPDELVLQIRRTLVEAQTRQSVRLEGGAETPAASPCRSFASSAASWSPASGTPSPCGPYRDANARVLVIPPIATTSMPSAARSRPRRAARVCSATRSLFPSTNTTARSVVTPPLGARHARRPTVFGSARRAALRRGGTGEVHQACQTRPGDRRRIARGNIRERSACRS
jgi:hypothetical protein